MRCPVSLLTPIAALALTACGGSDVAVTNASPEEVAAKVDAAGGARFNPGEWETTVETVSIDIPGLAGPMKDEMTKMMLQKQQVTKNCVTPEQAKSPPAEVLAQSKGRCTYEKFTMAGGKIDGTMVCDADGGKMTMKISGTFSDTAFAIDNDMETTMPGGAQTMKIKAKTSGKRVGECPGTKA
ncbi:MULTISPECIES: DUF3617 domain-containing protein [unclassified Sphingomonas]|uniref:DUF3617 domain-containing protein n=1 Tax=unclassified Sphingomonas TaxID=196159 RepID=UPI002151E23F|nr:MULTISPECIES: DUF3617 domain-containing protein [unclassified Sphingomonas]MCR5872552.1 DUF3617 domain-containing protein [Sphingomonas sp. J344]UUX99161.1 DUF3617 domain-containing protein [Sphingomonas sp. J315]